MDLISDILLIAGAAGAAFYCIVLSRRLSRFTNLDQGVGGAIAVLSAQVDDMTRALAEAQGSANGSTETLATLTERAEDVARRLELMVAAMHDLPEGAAADGGGPEENAADAVPDEAAAPPPVSKPSFTHARPPAEAAEPASLFRSHRTWSQEAAE
ncbi:MAG: hypothetical protein QNJ44_04020 [Rhodobacter sp.]|nr:hypothetical protein [Rhodobacter sp.]